MDKNSPEILELKRMAEERLKRKMKTPNDFIFLSGAIWDRTHETLSPTTLKRLWGYVEGAVQTRESTLDILSRFLGYRDLEDFMVQVNKTGGSNLVASFHIRTDDLQPGDRVSVSWQPGRWCTFRYLGDGRFIVEKAENSKLKEGDTFCASLFILGEPLYLSDLVHGTNPPVDFVVGNRDGLDDLIRVPGEENAG